MGGEDAPGDGEVGRAFRAVKEADLEGEGGIGVPLREIGSNMVGGEATETGAKGVVKGIEYLNFNALNMEIIKSNVLSN